MRNILYRIAQIVVLIAVASSLAHAEDFMYFKKKAAAAGGGPSYATPAYVNSASYYGHQVTINGVASGNLLIAVCSDTTGTPTFTTSAGSTSAWTPAGNYDSGGGTLVFVAFAYATATDNVTMTVTGTLNDDGVAMHEVSGIAASSPQDGTLQGTKSSSASFTTGNINIAVPNEYHFGVWASETADRTVTASGWTARQNQSDHIHKTFDRVVVGGSGNYNFSGSTGTSITDDAVVFVAFKAKTL